MAIIVFQHGEKGGPGRLGAALRDHGVKLDIRRPDLGAAVPRDLDEMQGLVILGGEQNVTDIERHAWMKEEAELIHKAHAAALPVIGICLGAQLIAHALGGSVGPKETPECGFRMMSIGPPGQTDTVLAGMAWRSPQVFVCGQEIKSLPAGAVVLASAETTKVAVFRAGMRTYGFLCHFECDRGMLADLTGLACGVGGDGSNGARISVDASVNQHYETYARLSARLCENIVAYLLPVRA